MNKFTFLVLLLLAAVSRAWIFDYKNDKDSVTLTNDDKPAKDEERPFYDASINTQAFKNMFKGKNDGKEAGSSNKKNVEGYVRLGNSKLSFSLDPTNYIKPLKYLKNIEIRGSNEDGNSEKKDETK